MSAKIINIFLFLFIISAGIFAQDGDVGNGGGVRITNSSSIIGDELKRVKRDVDYFIYLDELFRMGDVGNGGGASRWLKKLRRRIKERMRSRSSLTEQQINGSRYEFTKGRIPNDEYENLYLADITFFETKTGTRLNASDVYTYHIRADIRVESGHTIKHLVGLETIDGKIILAEDITKIGIIFNLDRP